MRALALLCAASVAVIAPFFAAFAMGRLNTQAVAFYATALNGFSHAFWYGGEAYPRVLPDANAGLGSPVFFFYPPMAFWLASLLEPFAKIDPDGILRLETSLWLATFASGIACLHWLRGRLPQNIALAGGLIYVLRPLRFVTVYPDFNLAQCWAIAWFPLILFSIDRMMQRRPGAGPACALGYALLLFTHLPSFIAFLPVSLLYGALTSADQVKHSWRQMGTLCAALLLALGLGCIALLPLAMLHVAMNASTGPFTPLEYHTRLFFTPGLFITPLLLALAAVWLYLRSGESARMQLRPWLVMLAFGIFMMTPLSLALWNHVLLLHYLQPPGRKFAVTLFPFAALLGALLLARLPRNAAVAWCLLYVAVSSAWPLYTLSQQSPRPRVKTSRELAIISPEFFRTRWIAPAMMTEGGLSRSLMEPRAFIRIGRGTVHVDSWQPRSIEMDVRIVSPSALVVLRRFYFPGWSVTDETTQAAFKTYPTTGGEGWMGIVLPQGEYRLTLTQNRVPGEVPGWFMTVLSLLVVILWLAMEAWRRKRAMRVTGSNGLSADTGTMAG